MKNMFIFSIICCLVCLQSCSIINEPYDGRWMRNDFDIQVNFKCECTEAEKKEKIKSIFYDLKIWLIKKDTASYLQLNPDHTFSASILDVNSKGTYQSLPGKIYLNHANGKKEKVKIQKNDVFVIFEKNLSQKTKEEAIEHINRFYPEIKDLEITDFKMILQIPPMR